MKKILFTTSLVLLGIIIFQACNVKGQEKVSLASAHLNPDSCFCNRNIDLQNILPVRVAQQMARDYKADDGKKYIGATSRNSPLRIEDARSAWFDLDTLKAYICKIQKQAYENNCTNLRLGIRIYYGKYPDKLKMSQEQSLRGLPSSYSWHHTLFLVPTFDIGKKHVDFDPYYTYRSTCMPYTLEYLIRPNIINLAPAGGFIMGPSGGGGDANNHGGLIPPPPGSGDFPIGN